jgi:hypothetical protein
MNRDANARSPIKGMNSSSNKNISKPLSATAAVTVAGQNNNNANNSNTNISSNALRICFRCNEAGHMANNCPNGNRKPFNNNNYHQSATIVENEDPNNDEIEINQQEDYYENNNNYDSESDNSSSESNTAIAQEMAYTNDQLYNDGTADELAAQASYTNVPEHQGVADTGATLFMTGDKSKLINLRPAGRTTFIHGVGGTKRSNVVGDMIIRDAQLLLRNVHYVPNHPNTIVSLGRLSESGFDFFSHNDKLYIVEKGFVKPPKFGDERIVTIGFRKNGLYVVNLFKPENNKAADNATRMSLSEQKKFIEKSEEENKVKLTPQQLIKNKTTSEIKTELDQHRNKVTVQSEQNNKLANIRIPKVGEVKSQSSQPTQNINDASNSAIVENAFTTEVVYTSDTDTNMNEINWHRRFGHAGVKQLLLASKEFDLQLSVDKLQSLKLKSNCSCEVCLLTRMKGMDIGQRSADRSNKAERIMEVWHADLIGPISCIEKDNYRYKVPSLGGNIYALIVVDEYSRYVWTIPIRYKSNATDELINLINLNENKFNNELKLKRLHSDQGGEFINDKLNKFLKDKGIEHTTSPAYLPEYNGVVERMNRTLNASVRSMLEEAKAPQALWGNALIYAAQIHNILPIPSKNSQIPSIVFGQKPDDVIRHVKEKYKVFGCNAYPIIEDNDRGKYQGNRIKGINLGWNEPEQRYYILLLTDHAKDMKVIKAVDVQFNENEFSYLDSMKQIILDKSEQVTTELGIKGEEYEVEEILDHKYLKKVKHYLVLWKGYRKPTWVPEKNLTNCKEKLNQYLSKIKNENAKFSYSFTTEEVEQYITNKSNNVNLQYIEPKNYKQALIDKYKSEWLLAIKEELNSLHKQQVFQEIDNIPIHKKLLRCIWVFKAKRDKDNNICKWKARLVVQGFMQQEGIDFIETYAPTMRMKILKLILAIAAKDDLEIKQIDFDTAFLNALLNEEIYVYTPEGYELGDYQKSIGTRCLKLNKALYGLKQAPREWNKEIHTFLNSLGYQSSDLDECLYQKIINDKRMYLTLFVDDTLAIYPKELENIWLADKEKIATKYKIKDLGDCEWIFNMKLERNRNLRQLTLSQEAYLTKVLEEHGYGNNIRTVSTPFQYSDITKIDKSTPEMELVELDSEQQRNYRAKVGAILYAANITRIDLQYIIGVLARYVSKPLVRHMLAINRVLRYIGSTKSRKLMFDYSDPINRKELCELVIYTDSDWATENIDRRSTSGWLVMLNNSPIAWQSKKQQTTATSTAEAEYYALGEGVKEALFIKQWIKHYYLDNNLTIPVLKSDNDGAILMSDHSTDHNRTKHIDIKHHFIREHIHKKHVLIEYIETSKQLADILTKPVKSQVFQNLLNMIFKQNITSTSTLSIKEGV